MDKAASKVLNDEGVVRKYNALLSRVSKSSLWEDAIERNASCKTVEVDQRVCLACWNYDKNTMSTNDGLPRYWVMIVSPQLQNILDSEKVCKLCSYRHGVLLEYADDVEFTPNLVRQKVPSQLLESVRVFLAKIYGFPTGDSGNILTGNEKELCWQHWCHWYYGLPEKLQRICEGKMLIVAGDTDLVIYASALHSLKAFGNKHVMIERQVKKSVGLTMRPEYIDIPRLCNALNEAEIWRDIPNPWILFTYVYILAGSDYVPAWAGAGHKTWFKHVKKHWRFVSTKQVPADDSASAATSEFPMQVELIPPHGSSGRLDVKLTFNNTAGLRIASLPYYQWSLAQLGKVPLETLWQQALTSPEKRDANLQERWNNHLFFGEVVPHGDDQAALEVIRRATHALPKGDEKKCLPSYDDLLGQCQRASYVLTLIFESIVERNSQVKHLFSDYGWELTDDGKVRIKWGQVEPPPEATNRQGRSRSAAQRQQQQSTRCGCKPNKDGIYCTSGRCKCTQCGPTCPCSGGRCAKRQQTQQPAAEGCNQGQQGAALPQPEAAAETNGGMPCHNTELQVYVEEEQEAADKVAEEDAGSSDEDEDEDARSEDALLAAQHPPGDGDEDEDENNM